MKSIAVETKRIAALGRVIIGNCSDPVRRSIYSFAVVFDGEDSDATYGNGVRIR